MHFLNADPNEYDVVFVANATAGIKLVVDGFRSQSGGFVYAYHQDSHTSLVGVREIATADRCLDDDGVGRWLSGKERLLDCNLDCSTTLFAYPAQSNLTGKRLPLSWSEKARSLSHQPPFRTYTLLDASALVSTSPFDLSVTSPDFVSLSFYKIFGFPDLGALIIRKDSGWILQQRKYFGGGTVDMVLVMDKQWHAPRGPLHESLEDGTLPFHSILALDIAIENHKRLYDSMNRIAMHTAYVSHRLYEGLLGLRHANGQPVCRIYSTGFASEDFLHTQGPVVAFNVRSAFGSWISNSEVMRLATVQGFHLRTGGACNPGGTASCLNLEPWEMQRNYSMGFKCSSDTDIYAGKITGIIRASLGAMSTISDVDAFVAFIDKFFVEDGIEQPLWQKSTTSEAIHHFSVKALIIYPIDGCGAMAIPSYVDWEAKPSRLAWDKEWLLVHRDTGKVLSSQDHSRMDLIRPQIDFQAGMLRLKFAYAPTSSFSIAQTVSEASVSILADSISVPLAAGSSCYHSQNCSPYGTCSLKTEINSSLSRFLGVPCDLVRIGDSEYAEQISGIDHKTTLPYKLLPSPPESDTEFENHVFSELEKGCGILVVREDSQNSASNLSSKLCVKANIIIGFSHSDAPSQVPATKRWKAIKIGGHNFTVLNSSCRCHLPFSTQDTEQQRGKLPTRLADEREEVTNAVSVLHVPGREAVSTRGHQYPTIRIGDVVRIERGG